MKTAAYSVATFWISAVLAVTTAQADIIGPQASGTSKELVVPDALLPELDEAVATQLKPLMQLYASNDYAGFKTAYAKISATTDTLPAVEVFWAKLLITNNRTGDAHKVLEEYIRDHTEDPEAFMTMGILAIRTGRFTDAWLNLLYSQRLMDKELLPKGRVKLVALTMLEARTIVAESRRQWNEADQMYQKLQALKPEDQSIKWRYGRSQVLAGNHKQGHQTMVQACQADAKLPTATLAVAQLLVDTTNWSKDSEAKSKVESWYQQAIAEIETDDKAIVAYFKWLVLDNRPEDVKTKFDTLPDAIKKIREVALIRSVAARYLNDLATAESLLTALHQDKPDDLEVADQLALVLIESTDEAKRGRALQLSERNFRAASEVEQVAATAAWVQLQLGSSDVADRILSQLASRGPLSPQTTYYIAELLKKSGKDVDSKRLHQIAVDTVGIFPQRSKVKELLAAKP